MDTGIAKVNNKRVNSYNLYGFGGDSYDELYVE